MNNDSAFLDHYGPWAVVAGASEGLGASYADQLARRGLNLVLIARRETLLQSIGEQLKEKHGIQFLTIAIDLSDSTAADQIINKTRELEVGLLVYNAGLSVVGRFLDRPINDHLKEIDTNIRTPLVLTYHFGQRMVANSHGGVILMASLSAFQGSAFISNYAASKAFNILLAEGLWEEWRSRSVDVLVCIAGAIRTPNYEVSAPRQTGRFSDATIDPEQVAREALAALGRQPYIIPGQMNRLVSFIMRHLLPRRMAIQFMGRILKDMYG